MVLIAQFVADDGTKKKKRSKIIIPKTALNETRKQRQPKGKLL